MRPRAWLPALVLALAHAAIAGENRVDTKTRLVPVLVTRHSQTLKGLAPGTTYCFRVRSCDATGNVGYSEVASFTASEKDAVPPRITDVKAVATTTYNVKFQWRTDEDADSQAEYGLTAAYGSETPVVGEPLARLHVVGVPFKNQSEWLRSRTPYHYRLKSRDAAGNLSVSDDMTFTVP